MTDTPAQHSPAASQFPRDPDEINLLEYAYVLVKNRRWIVGAGIVGLVVGLIAAHVKGPKFEATVLIAPREVEAQKTPNLGSLGALGGLVGAQLGLGATPGLDRIETILSTRQFNAEVIEKNDLLPELYRVFWRKAYRKGYDTQAKQWKQDFVPPVMSGIGSFLAQKVVKREIAKNSKNMTISLSTRDSLFSYQLLSTTVAYLNTYIRDRIQQEAGANVQYLDSVLLRTVDPLLREKVQALIATELEKMMMVSKEAFQTVDPAVVNRNFRHAKLYPLALAFGLGMLAMLWVVFAHAIAGAQNLPEDREYVAGIKRELRRWGL